MKYMVKNYNNVVFCLKIYLIILIFNTYYKSIIIFKNMGLSSYNNII